MSKRLLTLITVLLLLVVSSVAYGQEPTTDEPIFVLTEEQINAEFTIPSTATRTISNLEVDVQEDGVHISLDLTTTRNGTSTTQGIIAILIEQVQGNRMGYVLQDAMISGYGYSAPRSVQREVSRLVVPAWRNYVRSIVTRSGGEVIGDNVVLGEAGISFFGD